MLLPGALSVVAPRPDAAGGVARRVVLWRGQDVSAARTTAASGVGGLPGQVGDRGADGGEEAVTSRCAERRHQFRDLVREPGRPQTGREHGVIDAVDLDVAATDLARESREVGCGQRLRSGDVVRAALVSVLGQDRGGGRGTVLAGHVGGGAGTTVGGESPRCGGVLDARNLHVCVQVVAQHRPLQAAVAQRLLGAGVVGHHQRGVGRYRFWDGGVHDVPDTRLGCGRDGCAMRVQAPADGVRSR